MPEQIAYSQHAENTEMTHSVKNTQTPKTNTTEKRCVSSQHN